MPVRKHRRETIAIAALLVAVMTFTGVLTWQAISAERAQRAAVRDAIHAHATFVADDLARRTIFEFEGLTSLPLRRSILNSLKTAHVLPPVEGLEERLFLVDVRANTVEPATTPEPLRTWLSTQLPQIVANRMKLDVTPTLRVRIGDRERLIIYGVGLIDSGKIFGAVMRDETLGVLAARAFGRRPLFSPVVSGSQLTNKDVFIRYSRGRETFQTSTQQKFDPDSGVTFIVPRLYGDFMGGVTAQSSIARSAIPRLIVGGIPPSRIPLVIAAVLSSSLALAAVFVVLLRERRLAGLRADFVSGVSHELRTPLTQIRMFSETLLFGRIRSDEERRHSLQVITEEARRLTNLVDNVLFVSRERDVAFRPLCRDCELDVVIGDAIDAFAPLASRRDVVITTDMPAQLHACVDAEAWKQIVTNILDNAVKYGPPGQTLRVGVTTGDGVVRMTIDDEGPGIPIEERQRIWGRFNRLERDRGTHRSGSGLGLAIVEEIVKAHGGSCRVEDAAGGGARFVVEVPA